MLRFLLVFLLIPAFAKAQSITGALGAYRIGITTASTINTSLFLEEDQPRVKGTLALSCPHIRKFTATQVTIDEVLLTNLSLFFYNDTLFRISCDYSDTLRRIFRPRLESDIPLPTVRNRRCLQRNDGFQVISGTWWENPTTAAMVIACKGYDEHCQAKNIVRLTIYHKARAALSSECDLEPGYPFLEEIDRLLKQ